jgi:agmatinase
MSVKGKGVRDASLQPGSVAVVGVPFDEFSTFLKGAALAPPRIREALHSGAMNLCAEDGTDLGTESRLHDLGDLELESDVAGMRQIEDEFAGLVAGGVHTLAIGGDHSITYPIVSAYTSAYPGLSILHFDAHPDLYDEFDGSRYSHACPFARIMERGLGGRLVQVGIRTMNPHQRAQVERFGVDVVEWCDLPAATGELCEGPVYLSIDLDVLDPAYAPGVSHHEPGGLSTRELLKMIQSLEGPLVGADVVEYNPHRDPLGMTAAVAAKLVKEVAARILATSIHESDAPSGQHPAHSGGAQPVKGTGCDDNNR